MQTTATALNVIKAFEGFLPGAYICPGGKWTVGYGTTVYDDGEPVKPGDTIGHAEAEEQVQKYIRNKIETTLDAVFPNKVLPLGTRDALASFVYNLGPAWQRKWPTLKSMIDEGDKDAICDALVMYRIASGKPALGLHRRRLAECCLVQGWPWEPALDATWETQWRDLDPNPVSEEELFRDLEIPPFRRPSPDLPVGWDRMTEAEQTAYLNTGELIRLGGDPATPGPDSSDRPAPPVRVETVPPVAAPAVKPPDPFTDPQTGTKPIERSERVEGYTREREGERWLGAMRVLLPAGLPVTILSGLNSWPFWHLFAIFSFLTVLGAGYGAFRLLEGRKLKEHGRAIGSQGLH